MVGGEEEEVEGGIVVVGATRYWSLGDVESLNDDFVNGARAQLHLSITYHIWSGQAKDWQQRDGKWRNEDFRDSRKRISGWEGIGAASSSSGLYIPGVVDRSSLGDTEYYTCLDKFHWQIGDMKYNYSFQKRSRDSSIVKMHPCISIRH